MLIDAKTFEKNKTIETEICVIGSGAGGAVVAKELAERGRSVVLLEEGGYFSTADFNRNSTEMVRKLYRDCGMTATLGKPMISIPHGKCVGGTTVINSGTCIRLPDRVLEKWRSQEGLSDLTEEDLSPHTEKVEKTLGVSEPPRELLGKHNLIVLDTAKRLGLSSGILRRNAPGCKGSGVCCFGCPTGGKYSMVVSYIPEGVRMGMKVYYHCRAKKLRMRQGKIDRVIGVISTANGERTIDVRASVVIVSAGAIFSPIFLRRNRVAPESRALGKNLSIHPATRLMALFDEKVESWRGVPQGTYIDEFSNEGILFEGTAVPPSLSSVSLHRVGNELTNIMAQFSHIASYGFLVSEDTRGSIRHVGEKAIVFYQLEKKDVDRFIKGTEILAELFFAAGAKKVYLPIPPLPVLDNSGDIGKIRSAKLRGKDFELFAFHPMGTCRIGNDPHHSVVNQNLEVHDVEGLFVCDASIFPSSLGVNPQLTIMTFATRLANYLHQNASRYF
ncbi:MAG: GMC family oxidoreductase [Deltaproteobacteria bacterium]|nr:GMC family oxidoreductase [Deltaproteobacteria bacterium]